MRTQIKRLSLAIAGAGLFAVAGCGGGGGGSATTSSVTTTFSGTAATGAALANATVTITCASGAGTTTTGTNGSYSKDLTGITLPCALKATSSGGAELYSVTGTTSGSTQVANITPLTQLLVASLAGTDPATFFSNFSASTASGVTASTVSAAQTAVLTTLSNAGLSVSSLPDLLTGTVVAGSGTGYDGALDALATQLTSSGTSLATLTTTVAAASPVTTATTTTTSVVSLPASQLLKAADSNCSALRSGDYWRFRPTTGGTIADQFQSISYDASTHTNTYPSGSSVLTPNGTCRYLVGTNDIVVSQAGVAVARDLDDKGLYRLNFAIPKQTIAVSELAGTWNALGFEHNTSFTTHSLTVTISSTGVVSNVTFCDGASTTSTCSAPTPTITFSSNSAGGFDMTSTTVGDLWTDRAFAYRAGNGDLMVVQVKDNGTFNIWTQKRTQSLPTVGQVQSPAGWSIRTLNTLIANVNTLVANPLAVSFPYTATAIDSNAGSFTRTVTLADGTVDYSETILINTPRAGYNFRAAGSTTSVFDGRSVSIRERTSLGLRGMGVSVQSVPVQTGITSAGFQMSVDQP